MDVLDGKSRVWADARVGTLSTRSLEEYFRLGLQAMQDGQGIVIDLDFEKQMTETEIKSLCGQLQYCYASNTRSAVPCHLYFTSLQVLHSSISGLARFSDHSEADNLL